MEVFIGFVCALGFSIIFNYVINILSKLNPNKIVESCFILFVCVSIFLAFGCICFGGFPWFSYAFFPFVAGCLVGLGASLCAIARSNWYVRKHNFVLQKYLDGEQ